MGGIRQARTTKKKAPISLPSGVPKKRRPDNHNIQPVTSVSEPKKRRYKSFLPAGQVDKENQNELRDMRTRSGRSTGEFTKKQMDKGASSAFKTPFSSRGSVAPNAIPANTHSQNSVVYMKLKPIVLPKVACGPSNDLSSIDDEVQIVFDAFTHHNESRTSSSVAPAQQASSSKITPNLSKTTYGFSPTLYNEVAKSREGEKKVMVLKKFEAFLNNAATKDDLMTVSEKLEDSLNRQIGFFVSGLEKMIEDKLEARNNTLLRHMNKMLEEFFAKVHNIDGRLSIASSVDDEEPRDEYYGQAIKNQATGEIYSIIRSLGCGSFGKVFKAKDAKRIECAIKVTMEPPGPDDVVYELKLVDVIKSAKERGDHPPRFLAVSDHFEGFALGEIRPCEKMECYAIDLYDVLFQRKLIFTPMQTLQVIGHISSALEYLHKLGFVYADIKVDNVMLANMEMSNNEFTRIEARLIDFNAVLKTDGHPTRFIGQSIPYRAPEMALEIPCDGKIDVFSLGVVALQMITGSGGFYVITDSDVDGFSDVDINAAILGEIQRLIGPIPLEMCQQSKYKEFRDCRDFKKLVDDDHRKQTMAEACQLLEMQNTFVGRFLSALIRLMLTVDPKKRKSSADIAHLVARFTVLQPPKD